MAFPVERHYLHLCPVLLIVRIVATLRFTAVCDDEEPDLRLVLNLLINPRIQIVFANIR
jgi:hypothetical protein